MMAWLTMEVSSLSSRKAKFGSLFMIYSMRYLTLDTVLYNPRLSIKLMLFNMSSFNMS